MTDRLGTGNNASQMNNHIQDHSNPHLTTASQVGADVLGSASTVQANLDTHLYDLSNPHVTTASQVGAVVANSPIVSGTSTKVEYDTKGLIVSGSNATTSDISDSLNRRYVTDANLVTISQTSGCNTGDQVVPVQATSVDNFYLTGYNDTTGSFTSASVVSTASYVFTASGVFPISVSGGSVISLETTGIVSGSYNAVVVDSFGRVISGSNIYTGGGTTYAGSAIIDVTGSVVSHLGSGITPGSYTALVVDARGHIISGSNPILDHTINISNVGVNTHSQIDSDLLRLVNTTGSNTGDQVVPQNKPFTLDQYFVAYNATTGSFTSASVASTGSVAGQSYTGSAIIDVSGSIISHLGSGITSGSYSAVVVDSRGHIVSGSNPTLDHTVNISNVGINTHSQIDSDLLRLINTTGSNTGDVTVASSSTISLSIGGQQISASVIPSGFTLNEVGSPTSDLNINTNKIINVSDPTGEQDAATKSYVDTQVASIATSSPQGTYLISGGQVTWQSGYVYSVQSGTGYIDGVLYSWTAGSVALSAADATYDRIDVVVVDSGSVISVVSGSPASNPSEPVVDPSTQLSLALILVGANTSQPVVSSDLIYQDYSGSPTEWVWTTSGAGFNVNSTSNPRGGSGKDIEGTNVTANAYAQGQKGGGYVDPNNYNQFVFYLRFKSAWNTSRYLTVQFLADGVKKGNAIRIDAGQYGLNGSNFTDYQAVIIQTLQFAIPAGTQVNQLRILDIGGSIGFYIDDISLTTGGTVGGGTSGITQVQADARYLQRINNLSDVTSASMARSNISAIGRSGSTTGSHLAVWDGDNSNSLKDGGGAPQHKNVVVSTFLSGYNATTGSFSSGSVSSSGSSSLGEGPGISIVNSLIGVGLDSILISRASGSPAAEFSMTSSGFTSAVTSASSGDVIILPEISASGISSTLPSGISIVGNGTTLNGSITGPTSGSSKIYGCTLSGNIYIGDGDLETHNCYVNSAVSNTGSGVWRSYNDILSSPISGSSGYSAFATDYDGWTRAPQGYARFGYSGVLDTDGGSGSYVKEWIGTNGHSASGCLHTYSTVGPGIDVDTESIWYRTVNSAAIPGFSLSAWFMGTNTGDNRPPILFVRFWYTDETYTEQAFRPTLGAFSWLQLTLRMPASAAGKTVAEYQIGAFLDGTVTGNFSREVFIDDVEWSWELSLEANGSTWTSGSINGLISMAGDRSAWDVVNYGSRHANDWSVGSSHHAPVTSASTPTINLVVSGQSLSASLVNTSVSAGSYIHTTLIVDAQGRITSASSGGYSGSGTINISGSVVSHNSTGIVSGSYNAVYVDGRGHVISGSNIVTHTGSLPIIITGSVVSHATSGITSGSYNKIYVDDKGHVTAGSIVATHYEILQDDAGAILTDSNGIDILYVEVA